YTISKDEGTLTITQKEDAIVVTAKNASKTYDGTELKESGADVAGLPSGYTADVTVSGSITNAGSAANVVESVVIRDSSGNDVTDQFKTIIRNNGTLTVNKRTVNLSSASASKEYDGTALTAPTVTVTGDGFVDGEVSNIRAEGTITEIGSVKNTITYKTSDKFNKDNYDININEGTLTVSPIAYRIIVTAASGTKTYDGTPLEAGAATATGLPAGLTLTADSIGSRTDVGSTETRVNSLTLVIRDSNGRNVTSSYSRYITYRNGEITVTPRNVTLTSGSASKSYDGTPLTNSDMTVGGDGFVKGEGAEYTFTGSQTEVGESANTFRYTLNRNTYAGNYNITTANGTLTVGTPALYTVTIHYQDTDGNALASDYTGQYKEGDSFSIMSPDVQGYTPRTSYVMMPSMPARDVEVTVIYDTSAVPVTPVVPTNPTNPTTPTVPTTPTTPGTPANPTTPSTPATTPGTTTVTTTVIPAVIPGDGITGGGVITTDNDGNDTVTNLDDIKTPEAKKELNELCNILPFLFMLLTLITVLAYTKAMKDDQKKIFELTEELEEKKKNRF
ncbi:MAG: MucBP domain-containing protein, partial [Eubacteriales bacterium]|nr:MucBP domain-containing protein [Eubacteriales bacterium]